jgi:hypothetical protein
VFEVEMREYELAYGHLGHDQTTDDSDESDRIVCVQRVGAWAAGEHFAIRFTPVDHPAGLGLMVPSYTLDHMPTGYRVWHSKWLEAATLEQCKAVAEMLETAPVDWASSDPETMAGLGQFPHAVFEAAVANKRITWDSTWNSWKAVQDAARP